MNIAVLDEELSFGFRLGDATTTGVRVEASIHDALIANCQSAMIVWSESDPRIFGAAYQNDVIAYRKKKIRSIAICHRLPAKGPGSVSLELVLGRKHQTPLIQSDGFTEMKLAWLSKKLKTFESVFAFSITIQEPAYDC